MSFPLGKPILALIAVACITGGIILSRAPAPRSDLELWTSAQTHANVYAKLTPDTARAMSGDVSIRLIPDNALNIRLVSLFMADRSGAELPDVVEIRQESLGRYLAAPVDQVGFLPLNQFLEKPDPANPAAGRWIDRIIRQRFAPYTKDGQIFGVPHDVHPVTLSYRADLFDEAKAADPSIDLETPTPGKDYITWPDFQQRCLRFQAFWRSRGVADRWALDLFSTNASILSAMLLQRGINLIEPDGRVRLTDPLVAETLIFYAGLVAGPGRISADAVSGGVEALRRDLSAGTVCGVVTPDWRLADLRDEKSSVPQLNGRLRMIHLPKFSDADAPTTTWGGTMIAIPRKCRDPQRAWRLIESLYLSERGMGAQARDLGIVPAVADFWQSPAVRTPNALFRDGQVVNELYVALAPKIPVQQITPDTAYATSALGSVLTQTVGAIRDGADPTALKPRVSEWLAARQRDVDRQIEHGKLATAP